MASVVSGTSLYFVNGALSSGAHIDRVARQVRVVVDDCCYFLILNKDLVAENRAATFVLGLLPSDFNMSCA